jgi:2-(1,2-epoxy-1,2-dihydrophenyl)acetyl-CoA isomerase
MEIETGTDTVLAERTDGVGIITLNRPERRNALHAEMFEAVPLLLERFIGDPDVGCVMITGAGSAFCSGGDVGGGTSRRPAQAVDDPGRERQRTVEDLGTMLAHDARMVQLLHQSPKITLAALPGAAVGAGMSIALAADLRIAAESAQLIPGWGQLGFSGDFGGTWFLTRLIGPARALELLLDNRAVGAAEALSLGLFNRVVPDDAFRSAALAWAMAIAASPRVAARFMKENVQQAERLTLAEALPLESERMARSALTDDHKQAVARWLEAARAKRGTGQGDLSR